MKKKLLAVSIFLACATATHIVHAEGDVKAGKERAQPCAGCHGQDGNSAMPSFPKLASQHASYLLKQLQAFKNGSRNSPMMSPLTVGLDEKAMQDLAAFYESQKISANSAPVLADDDDEGDSAKAEDLTALLTLGGDLYRNGDLGREVSACTACHGPFGEGNKPASFPMLKGQHADYLIKTLSDFKNNLRSNVADNMMHMIARKMTDKEIKAVSYYISTMK